MVAVLADHGEEGWDDPYRSDAYDPFGRYRRAADPRRWTPTPVPVPALAPITAPVRGDAIRRRPSGATYRRRRVLVLGVALLVGVALGLILQDARGRAGGGPLTATGAPRPAPAPIASRVWVVHPGDTLWSIAASSGARGDIRAVVDRLSAEVRGQPLHPGQRIPLPAGT